MRNLVFVLLLLVITMTACEKADLISENESTLQSRSAKAPRTTSPAFGGRATGVDATIVSIVNGVVTSNQTLLAETGLLPITGGSLTNSQLLASINGVLTTDSVGATISGAGTATTAQSTATNLNLTIGGHTITASLLQANASASCGPVFTGSSQIQDLVIDGTPVTVTGAANQAVFFPSGGLVMINEQSVSKKGKAGSITVTALRVLLPNGTVIRIATTKADIKC